MPRSSRVSRYAFILFISSGACIFLVGALLLLLGPIAWLVAGDTVRDLPSQKKPQAIEEVRRTLLAYVAGSAGVAGLVITVRTYYLSRRGQVTDRYGRAIAQLASADDVERLGGVFALEHVLRESKRDHETVIEVLTAFVRDKSPVLPDGAPTSSALREDVIAAMTVLARRPERDEKNRLNLRCTDLSTLELLPGRDGRRPRLSGSDLCGARLNDVRMARVDLREAWLADADLTGADLRTADLTGAWLTGATLQGAKLQKATLVKAKLNEAVLDNTHFDGADLTDSWLNEATQDTADFTGADLTRAWLRDVNLEGSEGITKRSTPGCGFP